MFEKCLIQGIYSFPTGFNFWLSILSFLCILNAILCQTNVILCSCPHSLVWEEVSPYFCRLALQSLSLAVAASRASSVSSLSSNCIIVSSFKLSHLVL